jgi:hypothetical protein
MTARILYCHCAYANVVPAATKAAVLEGLVRANVEFEAVPDLCEMAARQDPRLAELAANTPLRIAACYPRAVKWLFASAGTNLDDGTAVCNMRTEPAESVLEGILNGSPSPGAPEAPHALPEGKGREDQ